MHDEPEPTGRNLRALHAEKVVPVEECACGFWAYWEDASAAVLSQSARQAVGIMEGWGKILIGDRGFRAQYARIVALHLPTDHQWLSQLQSQYPAARWYTDYEEMLYDWPTPNVFTALDEAQRNFED
jgi:hypothetical protein